MEQVRDLNIEADDMQVVLSAISGVSKRIKEVAQTHKPLFGDEHFLTGKEVCERLYISPRTLQDIGILPSEYVIKSKIINNIINYYTFV